MKPQVNKAREKEIQRETAKKAQNNEQNDNKYIK